MKITLKKNNGNAFYTFQFLFVIQLVNNNVSCSIVSVVNVCKSWYYKRSN